MHPDPNVRLTLSSIRAHLTAKLDYETPRQARFALNLSEAFDSLNATVSLLNGKTLSRKQTQTWWMRKLPDYIQAKLVQQVAYTTDPAGFLQDLISNPRFCLQVAQAVMKSPIRQSLHQELAIKHLQAHLLLTEEDVALLPATGPGAVYAPQSGARAKAPKSIDARWRYRLGNQELVCMMAHKFTEGSGGSQESQHQDARAFAEAFREKPLYGSPTTTRYYTAVDGDYYNTCAQADASAMRRPTRKESIREVLGLSSPVRALSTEEIPQQWAIDVGEFAAAGGFVLPKEHERIVKEAFRLRSRQWPM